MTQLILHYAPLGDSENAQKEIGDVGQLGQYGDTSSIAEYLGFYYQTELIEPRYNEFFPLYESNYGVDQVIEKTQPCFKHQIDESKFSYQIGIFESPVEEPEKPEKPVKPEKPKKGLYITLIWRDNNSRGGQEEFFIEGEEHYYFCFNLDLLRPDLPPPLPSYDLSDYGTAGQDYYLGNLYGYYGKLIKHQYDTKQYNYILEIQNQDEHENYG